MLGISKGMGARCSQESMELLIWVERFCSWVLRNNELSSRRWWKTSEVFKSLENSSKCVTCLGHSRLEGPQEVLFRINWEAGGRRTMQNSSHLALKKYWFLPPPPRRLKGYCTKEEGIN